MKPKSSNVEKSIENNGSEVAEKTNKKTDIKRRDLKKEKSLTREKTQLYKQQSPIHNNSKRKNIANKSSSNIDRKNKDFAPNKVETWEYYEMRNNIIKHDEAIKQANSNNFMDENIDDFIQSAKSQFMNENNDSVLEDSNDSEIIKQQPSDEKNLNSYQYSSIDAFEEEFDAKRKTSAKEMLEGITKRVVLNDVNSNTLKFHSNQGSLIPNLINEKSHLFSEPLVSLKDEHRNMVFSSMSMIKRRKEIEYNQLLECLSNLINVTFY